MRYNEFAKAAYRQKSGQLSPVGSPVANPAKDTAKKKVEDLAKEVKTK